jgi:hypothetical protein
MSGILEQGRKNVKKLSLGILRMFEEGRDHPEYMVLALQLDDVYREFLLGFASKLLAGEHAARVSATLMLM